jgi:hypothetical protein
VIHAYEALKPIRERELRLYAERLDRAILSTELYLSSLRDEFSEFPEMVLFLSSLEAGARKAYEIRKSRLEVIANFEDPFDYVKSRYERMLRLPTEAQESYWARELNYKTLAVNALERFNGLNYHLFKTSKLYYNGVFEKSDLVILSLLDLDYLDHFFPAVPEPRFLEVRWNWAHLNRERVRNDYSSRNLVEFPIRGSSYNGGSCISVVSNLPRILSLKISPAANEIFFAGKPIHKNMQVLRQILSENYASVKCIRVRREKNVKTVWDSKRQQLEVYFYKRSSGGGWCSDPFGGCSGSVPASISQEILMN